MEISIPVTDGTFFSINETEAMALVQAVYAGTITQPQKDKLAAVVSYFVTTNLR